MKTTSNYENNIKYHNINYVQDLKYEECFKYENLK